jgi:hypothetical protein
VAAAFQQYTSGFQWSWNTACSYLPAANPAIEYSPTGVTFDATASMLGVNDYGSNTLVSFGWDLNGDGVVDLTGTGTQFYESYDDLRNIYNLSDGPQTASLVVTVTNELGQTVQSDAATTIFYVPEPATFILLAAAAAGQLLGLGIKRRKNRSLAARGAGR